MEDFNRRNPSGMSAVPKRVPPLHRLAAIMAWVKHIDKGEHVSLSNAIIDLISASEDLSWKIAQTFSRLRGRSGSCASMSEAWQGRQSNREEKKLRKVELRN